MAMPCNAVTKFLTKPTFWWRFQITSKKPALGHNMKIHEPIKNIQNMRTLPEHTQKFKGGLHKKDSKTEPKLNTHSGIHNSLTGPLHHLAY
jgi:hypothetical protein